MKLEAVLLDVLKSVKKSRYLASDNTNACPSSFAHQNKMST
ncbi:MAG: hypothetical protein ABW208_14395 [Pyrinomonadaceae bacterium]